jgi:hypothetical protein
VDAGQDVVLAVLLAQLLDLGLEPPLLDLVEEVGHVLHVVRDRQQGVPELRLLTRVDGGHDVGRVSRADEDGTPCRQVGERHVDVLELDVLVVLEVLDDRPVLLERVVGMVAVQQAEVDGLRRLERRADLELLHVADLRLHVDGAGLLRAAAAGRARRQRDDQGRRSEARGRPSAGDPHGSPSGCERLRSGTVRLVRDGFGVGRPAVSP